MTRFVVALLVILSAPLLGVANSSAPKHAEPVVTFLPGSDVGTSPHATWNPSGPDAGLVLLGVQGARLVVDDGLHLQMERSTLHTRVHAEPISTASVEEFTLEFRRGDVMVGSLDFKADRPSLDLGPTEAGESLHATAVLSLSPSAASDTSVLVRLRVEAQIAPDTGR